jgi:hypothetical protein
MQADPGDTVLNGYLLEHGWRAVGEPGYRWPLWSPPFFHPQPLALAYSENLLGAAPVYWALRLGLPADLAYQWWMILLTGANFVAAAWAARRLPTGVRPLPHLLCGTVGYLWAFGLVHLGQLGHQQLIPRWAMPLALLAGWRFAVAPGWRPLWGLAGWTVLQGVTCVNSGWMLAFGLALFVPTAARLLGTGPAVVAFLRANRGRLAAFLLGWAAVVAPVAVPYVRANRDRPRDYSECVEYLPTPLAWVTPPAGDRWHDALAPLRDGVSGECHLLGGFALLALVGVAGRWAWRSRHGPDRMSAVFVLAALAAAGGLVLLTLNCGGGVSPWWLVRFLPGGLAVRAVSQVYVAVYLLAVPAAAVGFTLWLRSRVRSRAGRWLAYLIAAGAVVGEQTGYDAPSFPKAEVRALVERAADRLRGADVGYVLPTHHPGWHTCETTAMWAGLEAGVPVVNGYSGRFPPNYPDAYPPTDADWRAWLISHGFRGTLAVVDLAGEGAGVRYAVVGD